MNYGIQVNYILYYRSSYKKNIMVFNSLNKISSNTCILKNNIVIMVIIYCYFVCHETIITYTLRDQEFTTHLED